MREKWRYRAWRYRAFMGRAGFPRSRVETASAAETSAVPAKTSKTAEASDGVRHGRCPAFTLPLGNRTRATAGLRRKID
jgi:hypothetical protein